MIKRLETIWKEVVGTVKLIGGHFFGGTEENYGKYHKIEECRLLGCYAVWFL
jgi:hypothetical protein